MIYRAIIGTYAAMWGGRGNTHILYISYMFHISENARVLCGVNEIEAGQANSVKKSIF